MQRSNQRGEWTRAYRCTKNLSLELTNGRCSSKYFSYIKSFHPENNPVGWVSLFFLVQVRKGENPTPVENRVKYALGCQKAQ